MSDLRCGVCTGGVRLYRGTLYGRPITDWKHSSAPPGTRPHRPVLGRPVDPATLQRLHRKPVEAVQTLPEPEEPAVPIVPPRDATEEEIPDSARRMRELLVEHGWATQVRYYQTSIGDEAVVVRGRRLDLGAVAVWERRAGKEGYGFVQGFTRCRAVTWQVGSTHLKDWIRQPLEECPDCGASSAAHNEGECP